MGKTVQSTCNYCGVGCNVEYHLDDQGKIEKIKGAPTYPVNGGVICPKGFKIHEPILSEERGTTPLIKKNGTFVEASWDEAVSLFTNTVKDIKKTHGEKSVAFISTGQMYTEEMATLGQVARTGMKMEGDGNTRQCMASAVVGYKQSFGFDAPPMSYKEMEESDCIVLIGSNMPIAHPIVWNRMKHNTHTPDVVVIDPRFSDAAKKATLHLPIKPKRDIIFLYMVMNKLIQNNWIDEKYINAHTNGFAELKQVVQKYDTNKVEALTGISSQDFDAFVDKMHTKKRVSIWWTMGVNQNVQGTRTVQAIINLCLITGNIGKPGAGPCSLTGQANAMGSRLFSNTTSLFGGRDYTKSEDRAFVGKVMGLDPSVFPEKPTLPYDQIISQIAEGKIKGLWIICTNPLHSWINNKKIQKAVEQLDLLVVQDLYPNTLSAQKADIYLPAAGAGEKHGFLINSERRLGTAQKVFDPPGQALPDFDIFKLVAKHYGCEEVLKGWDTQESVFAILRACTEGMPCDITGVKGYAHLIEKGGIQWPYPRHNPDETQERRLFEDGTFYTADKKAQMLVEEFITPAHEPDVDYPFYMLTGRGSIVQFQSNTRTEKSGMLKKQMKEELYIEINEEDAKRLKIIDGEKIKVSSRVASIEAVASVGESTKAGEVFLPFHYPDTNSIIDEAFDSYSRQPSFKTGAVKLEVI